MYKTLKFERARDSLSYVIRHFNINEMHIPYYLCDVVRHTLVQEGCKPIFYHINDDFMPTDEFDKNDFVLYPNYFGVCDKNANKLSKIYPNLILDNAHAFFTQPLGIASFNSAYKFGLGEFSYLFLKTAEISDFILNDYLDEKLRRREKFIEIHNKYSSTNILKIDIDSVPFCYPYLAKNLEDADIIAKELIDKGFEVYRYWNAIPENYNEYKFYSRLVPLPIEP